MIAAALGTFVLVSILAGTGLPVIGAALRAFVAGFITAVMLMRKAIIWKLKQHSLPADELTAEEVSGIVKDAKAGAAGRRMDL